HEVLAADLSDAAARDAVEERLRRPGSPVDVLVNNAGIGTTGTFWTTDPAAAQVQYDLGVTTVFRLTRAALEGMVERDRGTIINVASFGALMPGSNGAAYTAAKSYVVALSERIAAELKGAGVSITVLCPGWTRTELHERGGVPTPDPGSAMWLDADDVVARAMSDVARGRTRSIPGLRYRLLLGMSEILPRAVTRRG
ncbi:MAG: SDR family NAD(P)-dependent oxidoreductase, partial [Pseudonocardia sp.]|nr:SDR family NAD(P)-dependent oxidoreductase [Pseudonocardia sp.]